MRFEPRIVRSSEPAFDSAVEHWSDEQFEAALPGDLEALAAQLRDDATHLAAKYPARSADYPAGRADQEFGVPSVALTAPLASERKRTSGPAVMWFSAGLLASVALVAAALPWMFPTDSGAGSKATAVNAGNGSAGESVAQDTVPTHLLHAPADKTNAREAARGAAARGAFAPTPALFLQNVSGPELEGLFDLWEADAVEQSRISI